MSFYNWLQKKIVFKASSLKREKNNFEGKNWQMYSIYSLT